MQISPPFLDLGEYSKIFTSNELFCVLERIRKLSNVFYKEKEVFKETKDVRNWLDSMFVLVSGKIKRGELGDNIRKTLQLQ